MTRKNTKKVQDMYYLILFSFIASLVVILFSALLISNAIHNQQIEINLIQQELLPRPKPIVPVYEFYNISIAPNFRGDICSSMLNGECVVKEVNASQRNVFDINASYNGNYTMDIYIKPPAKVSLEMIINYDYNQTQNILKFNNISGLNVFSGPQVPSRIKLIFSNEGNTIATGYLRIIETPK